MGTIKDIIASDMIIVTPDKKILRKWDYASHEYKPYAIPKEWDTAIYADLDDEVSCAGCGKKLRYGECYTSMRIHNKIGMGYAVCMVCHNKEWHEKAKSEGSIEE